MVASISNASGPAKPILLLRDDFYLHARPRLRRPAPALAEIGTPAPTGNRKRR